MKLKDIDLGKDEAEQDQRLQEYFLRTGSYQKAFTGEKTIIIGRKGSGKSAIFTLLQSELPKCNELVIPITPDQYSWSALLDYKEQGILPEQAHTNAWKLTLLSALIWKLNEEGLIEKGSKLSEYYKYMNDSFMPQKNEWLLNIITKIKQFVEGVKTQWISFDWGKTGTIATPLRIIDELIALLHKEWPKNKKVRIIIDRLDDSWDGSEESKFVIVGLLKASNVLNTAFPEKMITTTFIRSDIYDNLFFDDQDKLRQYEETLSWSNSSLKDIICERVKVSLNLRSTNNELIWNDLFSKKAYRSRASAEKYIIDRTFKRPRDIISFVRFALENAINQNHQEIEPLDTRTAEEEKYSASKYKDLIIENQKQFQNMKELLNSFSGSKHKLRKEEIINKLNAFITNFDIASSPEILLRQAFSWGIFGVKRYGRAGVKERGGAHFFYSYDDPSINPLAYNEFYIHPSLRYYLNISETREKIAQN